METNPTPSSVIPIPKISPMIPGYVAYMAGWHDAMTNGLTTFESRVWAEFERQAYLKKNGIPDIPSMNPKNIATLLGSTEDPVMRDLVLRPYISSPAPKSADTPTETLPESKKSDQEYKAPVNDNPATWPAPKPPVFGITSRIPLKRTKPSPVVT